MAIQPNYESLNIDCEKRLVSSQAVVEARLLPEPNIVIARVLSINCDSVITPSDVFTGELRYSGKANFKVLFIDVDGKNHSINYILDFNDKINSDNINNDTKPILTSKVLDIDIVNVSSGEIKLAAVLEINVDGVVSEQINYITNGGEGVYTNTDTIIAHKKVYCGKEDFNIDDEIQDNAFSKILMTESRVIIDKRSPSIDSIIVEGKIITLICGENENGELFYIEKNTPFTQECKADDTRTENTIIASAKLIDYRIDIVDKDEKSIIKLWYNIEVNFCTFSEVAFTPIIDAFCPLNELLVNGESLTINQNKLNTTIFDSISGSVTLENNLPLLDNILYCGSGKVSITNVVAHKDYAIIEGIMNGNIVYYNSETSTKNSLAVEVPFSLSSKMDCNETDKILVDADVVNLSVKIRRGNELDIKADICAQVLVTSENVNYMVTSLELGEKITPPNSAITIYIAKGGETLWELAKVLCTTPELVMIQNPDLSMPLTGGERIIAYRNLS